MQSNRRMVTNEEWQATATSRQPVYRLDIQWYPYSDPDVDLDGTGGLPPVIGRTESPKKTSFGSNADRWCAVHLPRLPPHRLLSVATTLTGRQIWWIVLRL